MAQAPVLPTPEQQRQLAQTWLRAPVPRLYANGFALAQTGSDISVIMLLNGAPVAITSLSFISAKTLVIELGKAVETIESALQQQIPTIEQVTDKLSKVHGSSINTTQP
jgi:hypothetical protein